MRSQVAALFERQPQWTVDEVCRELGIGAKSAAVTLSALKVAGEIIRADLGVYRAPGAKLPPIAHARPVPVRKEPGTSTRDQVLAYFKGAGGVRVISSAEVQARVKGVPAHVLHVLAELTNAGELVRVSKGQYKLASTSAPQAPRAAAPSITTPAREPTAAVAAIRNAPMPEGDRTWAATTDQVMTAIDTLGGEAKVGAIAAELGVHMNKLKPALNQLRASGALIFSVGRGAWRRPGAADAQSSLTSEGLSLANKVLRVLGRRTARQGHSLDSIAHALDHEAVSVHKVLRGFAIDGLAEEGINLQYSLTEAGRSRLAELPNTRAVVLDVVNEEPSRSFGPVDLATLTGAGRDDVEVAVAQLIADRFVRDAGGGKISGFDDTEAA